VDVDCYSQFVSDADLNEAMKQIIDFCEKVDEDFSTYKVGSWISRLRRSKVAIENCPDGAIATSGTYERGAHIHDPHSGMIAIGAASATVVGPAGWLCDAMATAVMVGGTDSAQWFAQPELQGYQVFGVNRHEDTAWEI
jgi:thiamine biosynthesis lipoprotein